jgi:hypothetical protein
MGSGNSGRSAEASNGWVAKVASMEQRAGGRSVGSPPPRPPSASERAQHDHQWLQTWQRNEIRWLRNRVAELEQQLRWRTITLGSALALSILAATGWAVALLYPDKPGLAILDPSVPFAPATRAPVARSGAEQAAPIATAPEDRMRTASSEAAPPSGAPAAAPEAEDAQPTAQLRALPLEPALDAMIELPAAEGAQPAAQLRLLEAERVLDAMIEEAASGHQSTSPRSAPAD